MLTRTHSQENLRTARRSAILGSVVGGDSEATDQLDVNVKTVKMRTMLFLWIINGSAFRVARVNPAPRCLFTDR